MILLMSQVLPLSRDTSTLVTFLPPPVNHGKGCVNIVVPFCLLLLLLVLILSPWRWQLIEWNMTGQCNHAVVVLPA